MLYWRHESFIKAQESVISSVVGANGSIYALKRESYVQLDEDLISDLVEPIKVVEGGQRVIYEPEAISTETTSQGLKEEFGRKVRIVARGFGSLRALATVLNPFRFGMFSLELISHKLLRWIAPWIMIALFILNIPLASADSYKVLLTLQLAFYLTALIGFLLSAARSGSSRQDEEDRGKGHRSKGRPLKVIYLPFYFCAVNWAAALGLIEYLRGRDYATWDTVDRFRSGDD